MKLLLASLFPAFLTLAAAYAQVINPGAGGGGGSGTVTSVGFTGGLVSVATPTTTPALTVAGTSGGIPYFASTSTWASSAAGTINHVVGWGGSGNAPVDLGVLPAGTVTSIATTGPITGGTITGTGTIACATCGVTGSPLSQFASTTSAQLLGTLSDATGTGAAVFGTAPTISQIVFSALAETSVSPAVAATSTAGNALALAASPAIAGNVTSGAANGGDINITAGNAARLVSGNGNGGNVNLKTGSLIGSGTIGQVNLFGASFPTTGLALIPQNGGMSLGRMDACCQVFIGFQSGHYVNGFASTVFGWLATSNAVGTAGAAEIGLDRDSSTVVGVVNGTQGTTAANYRDLKLRHMLFSGTLPTLTSGTGTIAGPDAAMRITLTAGAQTSVTATFGTAFTTNIPVCMANDETTAMLVQTVPTLTTVVLNAVAFGSADKITVNCAAAF